MNPVRILAGLAVVLAAAPLWLARANDDQPPPLGGASSPTDPFPDRSFADVVTRVEQLPVGTFMIDVRSQPAGLPRVWDSQGARKESQAWKALDDGTPALVQRYRRREVAALELDASPTIPATAAEKPAAVGPETSDICLDPPSEAEVWAKVPKVSKAHAADQEVQRNNVRINIEKIARKADPVKVYPLAGPCQLVHCHYKCTVTFDELSWSDDPIPFKHVDHKVEVVYIDKDHLRRAGPPQVATTDAVDARLNRLSREIAELKSTRQRDRREQEQILDRLIGELEGLKRELRDDSKDPSPAPPSKIR